MLTGQLLARLVIVIVGMPPDRHLVGVAALLQAGVVEFAASVQHPLEFFRCRLVWIYTVFVRFDAHFVALLSSEGKGHSFVLFPSERPLLLQSVQNGYPFLCQQTSEGVWGILHEGFYPARDASRFPEGRHGGLIHYDQKMVTDGVTGQGKGWSVTLIVKFEIPGGMPVAKGIVGTGQDNHRVSYRDGQLCHDASAPL